MRLRRLDLEYFGHFTGRRFDFGARDGRASDVHVVHGPNEAGKTTLMEGYLRLLYGFAAKSEPYDFLHGRGQLSVSAELEIGGEIRRFTRRPGRTGTLLDAAGAPVPEVALSEALAGLSAAEYRKLLCLDDETIEKGGDEIAASEGEIGRLLFSASAGVTGLTDLLDGADAEARALHLKGGQKSRFAGLRRNYDAVQAQIAEADVSAGAYRKLREEVARAEDAERAAREASRACLAERDRLRALAEALPLRAEIAEHDAALEPLAAYPATLDIEPEALVTLARRRLRHADAAERAAGEGAAARAAREALPLDPEGAALAQTLEDLRPLRDRCAGGEHDLPLRRAERDAKEDEMRGRLAETGLDAAGPPEAAVLDAATLESLAQLVAEREAARRAIAAAAREAKDAETARAEADIAAEAEAARLATLPDLAPILERHGAARLSAAQDAAHRDLAAARRALDAALGALAVGPLAFSEAPDLPLDAAEARARAEDLARWEAEVATRTRARAEADDAAARLKTAIAAREEALGAAADADAAETRAERDRLWLAHRAALTGGTADEFAAALRADDAVQAARQARSAELGALAADRAQLAEAERQAARRGDDLAAATQAIAERAATLARLLAALGLPETMPAPRFAEWVRAAEAATATGRALDAETARAAPALGAAEALRAELAAALDAPDAALPALLDMAQARLEARRRADVAFAAARHARDDTARAAARRRTELEEAEAAAEGANAAVDAAGRARWGAGGGDLARALPALRDLRALNEARRGLARQVAGMERDAAALATALGDLPPARMGPGEGGAFGVAAFDALSQRAEAATAAQAEAARLDARIVAAEATEEAARAEVEGIDAETALLARAFDGAIPTDTLDALRGAVSQAQTAIARRQALARDARRLCAMLGVPDRAAADSTLADWTPAALSAARAELDGQCTEAEAAASEASASLGAARKALASVTGEADIAALVAQRQLLELEMESALSRHLTLRLGHRLAEEALRRYRDRHRSGMMRAAGAAFAELTQGAYGELRVQVEGGRQTLVAVRADSGAAKGVRDLSKGTRFQLYLALRAAAYAEMARNGAALPFFCDDIFETFDEERTRAACQLMTRIGETGQAIYLTHHAHVVEIAREVCGAALRIHRL